MKTQQRRRLHLADDDGSYDPEFQIAPMADVLFVLLVFFISITSTEVLKKVANLELPTAQQSNESKKKSNQIVVNVAFILEGQRGQIIVDDKNYVAASDLVPMFRQRVAANPQVRVMIRADKNVPYQFIGDIMRSCSQAQIGSVTFAVLQGGADAVKGGGA